MSLLDDHVRRFNEGVRTGDFAPMAAGFTEDAEMHFEGGSRRSLHRPGGDRGCIPRAAAGR
jgi:hypothetical protein